MVTPISNNGGTVGRNTTVRVYIGIDAVNVLYHKTLLSISFMTAIIDLIMYDPKIARKPQICHGEPRWQYLC